MTARIPLWIDLRHVPAEGQGEYRNQAVAAACEQIFDELPNNAELVVIKSADDQAKAESVDGTVIVDGQDWTIIPLENLIAARRDRPGTLFALARSPEQAGLFAGTLEIGVHGIVLAPASVNDIAATHDVLVARGARVDDVAQTSAPPALEKAVITGLSDAGMGDRVCIDCTAAFTDGEGLLVGNTALGFVLVHAETIQTGYVNARPFRVNAGAIHSYLLGPGNRTQYLSESAAGQHVMAVNKTGATREMTVGRAKIEQRPHTLLTWKTDADDIGSAVLQNAETIRLVAPDGKLISITEAKAGDEILVNVQTDARHFGMAVKEKLEER